MFMTPSFRKLALAMHLTCSLGWTGAVIAYLALGISAATSLDSQTIRAAWIAMELTGWYVILPLSLVALLSGIVMALGSPWGLFRHYWILISLLLTTLSIAVLLGHMPTVSALTTVAREGDSAQLGRLGGDLFHAGLALLVLLMTTALNMYKPRGLTPYGWRKRSEKASTQAEPDVGLASSPRRWVKVLGGIAVIMVLLIGIMILGGGHGPASHMLIDG